MRKDDVNGLYPLLDLAGGDRPSCEEPGGCTLVRHSTDIGDTWVWDVQLVISCLG
jgi:hypothetical protein